MTTIHTQRTHKSETRVRDLNGIIDGLWQGLEIYLRCKGLDLRPETSSEPEGDATGRSPRPPDQGKGPLQPVADEIFHRHRLDAGRASASRGSSTGIRR